METLQLDASDTNMKALVPQDRAPETFDEIDKLGITFEKMQHSLNDNLQSILELSLTEERLKYQLLQSQINPHFLYNILGSIPDLSVPWKAGYCQSDADESYTFLPHDTQKVGRPDLHPGRTDHRTALSGNGKIMP